MALLLPPPGPLGTELHLQIFHKLDFSTALTSPIVPLPRFIQGYPQFFFTDLHFPTMCTQIKSSVNKAGSPFPSECGNKIFSTHTL